MSQRTRLLLDLTTEDAGRPVDVFKTDTAWFNSVLKRETVTLPAGTFTALTVPAGASAVAIDPGRAPLLKLKGVTGDTGTTLTPASNVVGVPVVLPLGTSPSLGLFNGDSVDHHVVVVWYGAGSGTVPD